MIYTYLVTRYVQERFEVEIKSKDTPTRRQILDKAENPHSVLVTSERVRELSRRMEYER